MTALACGAFVSVMYAPVAAANAGAGRPDAAAVWQPCEAVPAPDLAPAIARAAEVRDGLWIEARGSRFVGFRAPGEKRNPFDLSPPDPNAGPRDGMVEARTISCLARVLAPDRLTVRYLTAYYRFYENGVGWSPTLRDGILLELELARSPAGWTAAERRAEDTVFMGEDGLSRPTTESLPADAAWARPAIGCPRGERWSAKAVACERRRK
jgi:hypothetical protein